MDLYSELELEELSTPFYIKAIRDPLVWGILLGLLILLAAQYFLCPSVDEMIEQARAIDWSNVTELR
jgi:hypothetical protein